MTRRGAVAALALAWTMGLAALDTGDPAPPLTGIVYLKGQAPDLAAQWTLVEFWATWCAPCRRTIPHLTDLQQRHGAALAILGLSDEPEVTVRPFVEAQGEAMQYRVGLVPKETREAYMAGRSAIPCAFLISPQRQVAWVGHPGQVDPVLEAALAGRLDVDRQRRLQPLEQALGNALRSRNPEMIIAAADALLAADPTHLEGIRLRVALARQMQDVKAARAVYARLEPATLAPDLAASLAYDLLREAELPFRFLDLVGPLVRRVSTQNPDAAATLALEARQAYALGRLETAITLQERAAAADPTAAAGLEYYREVRRLQAGP